MTCSWVEGVGSTELTLLRYVYHLSLSLSLSLPPPSLGGYQARSERRLPVNSKVVTVHHLARQTSSSRRVATVRWAQPMGAPQSPRQPTHHLLLIRGWFVAYIYIYIVCIYFIWSDCLSLLNMVTLRSHGVSRLLLVGMARTCTYM